MNILEALDMAAGILGKNGIVENYREAASLLVFAIQKEKAFLIAHPEHELSHTERELFIDYVERRAKREPFQYITGHREFYGLDFTLTPDVLIPRPETELLVEQSINTLSTTDAPVFLEIGVGSGCVSISALYHLKNAKAVGVDISEKALLVAQANADKHQVEDRLSLRHVDLYDGLSGEFDLIVSNPPYVPQDHLAGLQPEVTKYEPHIALDGGVGGLAIIERIINGAPRFLKPRASLLLEIGIDQIAAVRAIFDPTIWEPPESLDDVQGIPRVVKTRLKK